MFTLPSKSPVHVIITLPLIGSNDHPLSAPGVTLLIPIYNPASREKLRFCLANITM